MKIQIILFASMACHCGLFVRIIEGRASLRILSARLERQMHPKQTSSKCYRGIDEIISAIYIPRWSSVCIKESAIWIMTRKASTSVDSRIDQLISGQPNLVYSV